MSRIGLWSVPEIEELQDRYRLHADWGACRLCECVMRVCLPIVLCSEFPERVSGCRHLNGRVV